MMTYINFPRRIARFQQKMKEASVEVLVGTKLKTITHLRAKGPGSAREFFFTWGQAQTFTSCLPPGSARFFLLLHSVEVRWRLK